MRFTIDSPSRFPALELTLDPGEELLVDPASIVTMSPSTEFSVARARPVMAGRWWGSLGDKPAADPFHTALLRAEAAAAQVRLASPRQGTIAALVLKPAEEYFLVQSHFLACAAGLSLSHQVLKSSLPAVRNKQPPSLSLLQLAGPGEVFVDCQGEYQQQELGEDESLWVSVRCLIGFDGNLQIDWGRSLREVRQPISRRYQEAFLRAIGPGRIAYQTRPGRGGVAI